MIPKHTRLWLGLTLIALLVACGGTSKPTIKLSATPTSLEDGQEVTLSAEATSAQKVEFYRGTNKVGEDSSAPYELKLPLTSDNDATLVFTAKVIAAGNQSALSEPVSVGVKVDKEAPKVSLVASNSNLSAAGAVTLTAAAADNKGVVKVEFFKGVEKLGDDTTSEDGFSLVVTLSAEHNGSLKYTAKAYDKKGNVGTSAEATVSVDIDIIKPTISLSANKTTVTTASPVTLTADASDNKALGKVEFYEGTKKLSEDTQAPYTYELNFTASHNGPHSYTAKAFDASGNTEASALLSIGVDIDTTSPTVSLSVLPGELSAPGLLTLTATATDNRGVSRVEFYKNGSKIGEDTSADYSFQLDYQGSHKATDSFSAKAYDDENNIAISNTVEVAIDIDITNPTLSLSASAEKITQPGDITLTIENSDNQKISKLELFRKGPQDAAPVLLQTWNNPAASVSKDVAIGPQYNPSVEYIAKVYDAKNNSATSGKIIEVEIKPEITEFKAATNTLNLNDAGGTIDLVWSGNHVLGYTLEVSPSDAGVSAVVPIPGQSGNTSGRVTLPANLSNQPKTYTATLKATSYGNPGFLAAEAELTLSVGPDKTGPVFASFISTSTDVTAAQTITLKAEVSDGAGIDRVEFYEVGNQTAIATITSAPYQHTLGYTYLNNANHSYKAVAFDRWGNSNDSSPVDVKVNIAPPAGSLDASFGLGGKLTMAIGSSIDELYGMVVQSDGKIVAAGASYIGGNRDFAVVRYNPDGSLDSGFGIEGKTTTAIGSANEEAFALALQPDGKIVLAGYSEGDSDKDFALVRLHSDGSLDSSFDTDGKVTTDFGANTDMAYSVAIAEGGKIVVAGFARNPYFFDFALARFNSDGSLDTSFDGDGKVTTSLSSTDDGAYALAIQSDGKIVAAGSSHNGSNHDLALVRYNQDGSPDTAFDTDGKLTTAIGSGHDFANALVLYPGSGPNAHKIVVAGVSSNGSNNDFALLRYNPDGSLDTGFGTGGKVTTDFANSYETANAVALQSDGKIVLAGYRSVGFTSTQFALARYNPGGSLDTGFGTGGKVSTAIGTGLDEARSIAIQADGKIVLAGKSQNGSYPDFALVRYYP